MLNKGYWVLKDQFRSEPRTQYLHRPRRLKNATGSVAVEAAGECALIKADRKLVAEACQQRFADRFVMRREIDVLESPTVALGD